MSATQVIIRVQNARSGIESPLAHAWVYWRPQSIGSSMAVQTLRTDGSGRVMSLSAGGDATRPSDYTAMFFATRFDTVSAYFSRGAKPIPTWMIPGGAFVDRTIMPAPTNTTAPAVTAPVNTGNNPNSLSWSLWSLVVLPDHTLRLERHEELFLWPLLWELPADNDLDPALANTAPAQRPIDYATAEFDQGSRIRFEWSNQHNGHMPHLQHATAGRVQENAAAPAPPDDVATTNNRRVNVRPREMGLRFEVAVDPGVTELRVQLLNNTGSAIPLRQTIARSSAIGAEMSVTNGTAASGERRFTIEIHFAHLSGQTGNTHAPANFGFVQLLVQTVGGGATVIESFTGVLCGFQVALVDDFASNPNGALRGPTTSETNETIHVDFLNSGQHDRAAVFAEARVRRMQTYELRNQARALGTQGNVVQPQMPMWMAEFQALGLTQAVLEELMNRRAFALTQRFPGAAREANRLIFELGWRLSLSWDGPDRANDPNATYRYNLPFARNERIVLKFDELGHLHDDSSGLPMPGVGGDGTILGAVENPPAAVPFPVATRRAPRAMFSTAARPWGRFAGASSREAMIFEYQPRIVETRNMNEVELIRGGDGRLSLSLTLNDRTAPTLQPAPPMVSASMRLPPFRVRGRNMEAADVEALVNALASEHFHDPAHGSHPELPMLPEAAWRDTCRLIFRHETGGLYSQFDERRTAVRFLSRGYNRYYGNENGMPFFGGPHGYGIAQVDYGGNVPAGMTQSQVHDEIWSVVGNLRGGVRHVMGHDRNDKARAAHAHLSPHTLTDARRMRAIFQREVVRRYNGGSEFRWNGTDWVINPTLRNWEDSNDHSRGANTALLYPNRVLGSPNNSAADAPRGITYYLGNGQPNVVVTGNHADEQTEFPRPITFAEANYGSGL